ncbi:MAG: YigZ family protein [Cryobacterium sp.]|uniref:IMPACT family protein n=1 Tax=unclassified Cryobacterium TaxID=2649013 RepID=UPI0018C943DB|nr:MULTISPECIES: YigZ family protein [unclassified Cryobacterium]MCY7404125.1 YigZ family protein [Cryobacterium sp.]MEC5154331.1 putative YigZ family protein [Cryobacterium sp. CAN_C3]
MPDLTLHGGDGSRVDAEIEVKRSRFLCRLVRTATEDAARAVIDDARKDHWNARHHCSAFVLGPSAAPDQVRRSNDDGEPSGTAGRPMLEALAGRGFVDCVAVVTRYFGGTLLGAGGLVRAYSEAVLTTIDEAQTRGLVVARERRELFTLALSHTDAGRIEAELRQRGVLILGTDYGRDAVLHIADDDAERLAAMVAQVTAGGAVLAALGHEWVDVKA